MRLHIKGCWSGVLVKKGGKSGPQENLKNFGPQTPPADRRTKAVAGRDWTLGCGGRADGVAKQCDCVSKAKAGLWPGAEADHEGPQPGRGATSRRRTPLLTRRREEI